MSDLVGVSTDEICSLDCSVPPALVKELNASDVHFNFGVLTFGQPYEPTDLDGMRDPTGRECLLNKWHIEDYVEGEHTDTTLVRAAIAFASGLHRKIALAGVPGVFRAIVSVPKRGCQVQSPSCVVRVHALREGPEWLSPDLNSYEHEALLTIDSELILEGSILHAR